MEGRKGSGAKCAEARAARKRLIRAKALGRHRAQSKMKQTIMMEPFSGRGAELFFFLSLRRLRLFGRGRIPATRGGVGARGRDKRRFIRRASQPIAYLGGRQLLSAAQLKPAASSISKVSSARPK